jgi:hypothetical protein
MPRTIRVIAVGLLLLALGASTVAALPSESQMRSTPRVEVGEFVSAAWEWLVSILVPYPESPDREPGMGQVKEEHGSQVDPDGNS